MTIDFCVVKSKFFTIQTVTQFHKFVPTLTMVMNDCVVETKVDGMKQLQNQSG